jgi:hypothetical protein
MGTMRPAVPRSPRRHGIDEIMERCPHVDGDPEDGPCDCVEKDAAAYDAECESRYDRWKDGDDDRDLLGDDYDDL